MSDADQHDRVARPTVRLGPAGQDLAYPPSTDEEDLVDRTIDFLQHCLSGLARSARTAEDVEMVATWTAVLRTHFPVALQVLWTEAIDGSDHRQMSLSDGDGGYIGVDPPMIVCSGHVEIAPWPCADVAALAQAQHHRPGFHASDWVAGHPAGPGRDEERSSPAGGS